MEFIRYPSLTIMRLLCGEHIEVLVTIQPSRMALLRGLFRITKSPTSNQVKAIAAILDFE